MIWKMNLLRMGLKSRYRHFEIVSVADDIVIFSETEQKLQPGLDILHYYCQSWKLKENIRKTKVMVFRKGVFCQEI